MSFRSGRPSLSLLQGAMSLLANGNPFEARKILSGSVHGAGYDTQFYALYGTVLLACGEEMNAGRFLFLSGVRTPETLPCIQRFILSKHDPSNFRQLHSSFPRCARSIGKISLFPPIVRQELKELGFPDSIQEFFIQRKRLKSEKA